MTSSLMAIGWGRNARADVQMTFWISLAMACAFWAFRQRTSRRRRLLLRAAVGLGNLSKQVVPLFVLLPLAVYLWLARPGGPGR